MSTQELCTILATFFLSLKLFQNNKSKIRWGEKHLLCSLTSHYHSPWGLFLEY